MKYINNFAKYAFSLILLNGLAFLPKTNAQVGQIIWEENFNTLNSETWNTITGDGCPELCGWGNHELEYYKSENVTIEEIEGEPGNYALVLEAKDEINGGSSFTSGKISTEGNVAIKYGMIEVRMKVPDIEVGLWPAVWLLGTNHKSVGWPQCGEIDIMEMGQSAKFRADKGHPDANENDIAGSNLLFYSKDACADDNQTCAASIAYDNYYCTPYRAPEPLNDRFVIYRVYWDDKNIQFTVEDNGVIHNMYTGPFPLGDDAQEFNKPFYMILNLAVGGDFTDAATPNQVTAPIPGKMYVDYIRVRKWNGKGEITRPGEIMSNAGGNLEIEPNDTVFLNADGSYGDIQKYEWTIADSIISTEAHHKLVLPTGTHNVKLTVFNAEGNSDADEIVVRVGDDGIGEIIWEENFNDFDADIWNIVTGDGCDEGPHMCGWGNFELEYYHPDNVSIEEIEGESGNKALVLSAKEETMGNSSFTSGKITTEQKLAIKYGVVEVRMKVPDVETGLWPAAWMLGINHREVGWPQCGEIDMMEMGQSDEERARQGHAGVPQNKYVGANLLWHEPGAYALDNQTSAASIAFDTYYDKPYIASSPLNERFVIYRTYWNESQIRFTVVDNGVEYDLYEAPFPISEPSDAFRKPFYFVLNLAVGGRFTDILTPGGVTAPMPAKMLVDYVRVRKWNGKGEVSFVDGNSLANAGADQAVVDTNRNGSEFITLNAENSYGKIVDYNWSENGAQIASGKNPTIELTTGQHIITLTTTDTNGYVSTDDVMIDVREIIWEENFNTLNTDLWNVVTGDGCPELCGWGNQELEYYHENNVYTEEIVDDPGNYALVLEAKSESMGSSSFTSGKVTTKDNMSVRYGLIEVRMQVPDLETGLWPAAWLLGKNFDEVGWPECGEIDMMEMGQSTQFRMDKDLPDATENEVVGANLIFYDEDACSGENQDCAASISFDNYYCNPYNSAKPLNDRFVTYRTYWDDLHIRFTVEDNGKEYDLYTAPFPVGNESSEFHKPFYLLLNLAVGGNFTDAATVGQVTAPIPAKMLVDYVRVMKWNGKGEIDFNDGLIANAGTDILVVDKDGDKKETVTLDGTGSISYDGSIVSYTWTENGTEVATGSSPSLSLSRASHEIVLTVTDDLGQTESDTVNVIVSGGGLAPIADAGNDTIVYDDNDDDLVTFTLDGSKSTAANAPIIKYNWINGLDTIATGVSPTVELSTGVYEITLEVIDEDSLIGNDQIIITVIDPNNVAPVANAGNSVTAIDNDGDDLEIVSFDASGSSDSDGVIEDYTWLINETKIATGVNPSVELSTGFYSVKLQVTDDDGTVSFSQVSATIIDPDNIAPVAIAGFDTTLIDEDLDGVVSYTLDASLSSDTDGYIASYEWFENNEQIASESIVKIDFDLGIHSVVLVTSDDDGISDSDTILVKVNQLPVANAGTDTLIIDTDQNGSQPYLLDGSESYDPYGTISTYSWVLDGNEIGTTPTLSYNFNLGTNVVSFNIIDDYGSEASDEVVVIVADPDNEAPVANAGIDTVLYDNNNDDVEIYMLDASASTDAEGEIYSYAWFENDILIANGATPTVTLALGMHTIELVVTDNQGATASDILQIFVKSVTCDFEACNEEFTAEVLSSSASNTSITFIPAIDGYGETTCILYYTTNPDQGYPGYNVTPNEPYTLSNVNDGQEVHFYFTYSRAGAPENSTYECIESFIVGACGSADNSAPVADAGEDVTLILPENSTTLDGSGSYDPDLDPITYLWKKVSGPDVNLSNTTSQTLELIDLVKGTYVFSLTVSDDNGFSNTDEVIVRVTDYADDVNIALDKPTFTSSNESGETTGANAVDGDETTRWSSEFSDPQWIYVDLEANYLLSKVNFIWEAAHAKSYEIQVSDDAKNWSTLTTESNSDGDSDEHMVVGSGRYVRMYGISRATEWGYSLYEFEIYGSLNTNSVMEPELRNDILIYPNPVNDLLNVNVGDKEIDLIMIYNTQGLKIKEEHGKTQINMSNLNKGLYLIQVNVNGTLYTQKVIKR